MDYLAAVRLAEVKGGLPHDQEHALGIGRSQCTRLTAGDGQHPPWLGSRHRHVLDEAERIEFVQPVKERSESKMAMMA